MLDKIIRQGFILENKSECKSENVCYKIITKWGYSMLSRLNGVTKIKSEFEPSMKIVSRILNILLEKNSIGRTELSQLANLHYGRLSKYLTWLKKKSLIEFVAVDEKIVTKLTHIGRNFAIMMSEENQ